MTLITAPTFRIASIEWGLDRPAQVNRSAWTGRRTVVGNPWHAKWRARVELTRLQGDAEFRSIRAFFARCKGQINTFRLPATVEAQNANTGVTLSAAAAAGATELTITGAGTAMEEGQMVTLNDQLLIITEVVGGTLTFEPTLRIAAASGTTVETANPTCLVALSQPEIAWSIAPYRMHSLSFDVEEAIEAGSLLVQDSGGSLLLDGTY